jgi:P-type E1-E2 ATPase
MKSTRPRGVTLDRPGRRPVLLTDLVLDFTGTLSLDGRLLPGVAGRVRALARVLRVTVMTADTFGTARAALSNLPVTVRLIATGRDKGRFVRAIGAGHVAAIGNGRNDVAMVRAAALGIAAVGPEGAAGDLVRAADVVAGDIRVALDLLAHPLRLKATLRD